MTYNQTSVTIVPTLNIYIAILKGGGGKCLIKPCTMETYGGRSQIYSEKTRNVYQIRECNLSEDSTREFTW
jgi:hypothetical protein